MMWRIEVYDEDKVEVQRWLYAQAWDIRDSHICELDGRKTTVYFVEVNLQESTTPSMAIEDLEKAKTAFTPFPTKKDYLLHSQQGDKHEA